MTKTTPVIIVHETIAQSWIRDASSVAGFVALISIGVYLDSSAMQWVGAILGFLTICGSATAAARKHKMTVAEARKRLDEIERGQA